jgi:hypothetical protein
MPIEIKIIPPKYEPQLLSAVEQTLKAHGLRLKANQNLEGIADAITAKGFKLSAEHGYLNATQTTAGLESPAHVNTLFEALATQEPARFFPRNPDNVTSREELDFQGKVEFLKRNGLAAYEALKTKASAQPTVLSNQMTRKEYLSLDWKTRSEVIGQLGLAAIEQIMKRA